MNYPDIVHDEMSPQMAGGLGSEAICCAVHGKFVHETPFTLLGSKNDAGNDAAEDENVPALPSAARLVCAVPAEEPDDKNVCAASPPMAVAAVLRFDVRNENKLL